MASSVDALSFSSSRDLRRPASAAVSGSNGRPSSGASPQHAGGDLAPSSPQTTKAHWLALMEEKRSAALARHGLVGGMALNVTESSTGGPGLARGDSATSSDSKKKQAVVTPQRPSSGRVISSSTSSRPRQVIRPPAVTDTMTPSFDPPLTSGDSVSTVRQQGSALMFIPPALLPDDAFVSEDSSRKSPVSISRPPREVASMFRSDITVKKVNLTAKTFSGVPAPPPSFSKIPLAPQPLLASSSTEAQQAASSSQQTSPSRKRSASRRAPGHQSAPVVVTEIMIVKPIPAPIDHNIVRHLFAYEHQGNVSFYSQEALQQRQSLRQHYLILGVLESLWGKLPRVRVVRHGGRLRPLIPTPNGGDGSPSKQHTVELDMINFEMFRWLHKKLYEQFACDPCESLWTQICSEDWRGYCSQVDKATMDGKQLFSFLFNFADTWSETLDAQEYRTFLETCSSVILDDACPFDGDCTLDEATLTSLSKRAASARRARGAALGSRPGTAESAGDAVKSLLDMFERTSPQRDGDRISPTSPRNDSEASNANVAKLRVVITTPPPATDEERKAEAQLRSAQALAAVQQSTKVLQAYVASGIAEVDTTEVRQLQGLFRLVCELEDHDEDELQRIVRWASEFYEDFIGTRLDAAADAVAASVSAAFPASSIADSPIAVAAAEDIAFGDEEASSITESQRRSALALLRQLESLSTDLKEFVEGEAEDRRMTAELVARVMETLSSQPRSVLAAQLLDVRQRISSHWRSGLSEKTQFRKRIETALDLLQSTYETLYHTQLLDADVSFVAQQPMSFLEKSLVGPRRRESSIGPIPRRSSSVVGGVFAPQQRRGSEFGFVKVLGDTPTDKDSNLAPGSALSTSIKRRRASSLAELDFAKVVADELRELRRCLKFDGLRAKENESLIDFIAKELAAQKPITTLMEATLMRAKRVDDAALEVEVGSAEWKQHVQSIAQVSVGLYNVTDGLHQEMQRSLMLLLDTSEANQQSLYGESRFQKLPAMASNAISKLLSTDKARFEEAFRQEREKISVMVSDLRLLLNRYFTKLCSDEATLLSASSNEVGVRRALSLRVSFFSEPANMMLLRTGNQDAPLASTSGKLAVMDVATNNSASSLSLHASWFTSVQELRESSKDPGVMDRVDRCFCAIPFFLHLQHLNVEWTCKLLCDITATLSDAVLRLHYMRRQHEAAVSMTLIEVERLAAEALLEQHPDGTSMFPTSAVRRRSRADRMSITSTDVLSAAAADVIHDTVSYLIGVPQKSLSDKSAFFVKKATEWRSKRIDFDDVARQLGGGSAIPLMRRSGSQSNPLVTNQSSDISDKLRQANAALDAHSLSEEKRKEMVEHLRHDELDNITWMRAEKEEKSRIAANIRRISSARGDSAGKQPDGGGVKILVPAADSPSARHKQKQDMISEQRRALEKMKLQRLQRCAMVLKQSSLRFIEANLKSSESVAVSSDASLSGSASSSGKFDQMWMDQRKTQSGQDAAKASRRVSPQPGLQGGADMGGQIVVAEYKGDAAFEKRKLTYIRSRLSNADIFVAECVKKSCNILDAIRMQLSDKPRCYDTRVFPFRGASMTGTNGMYVELLRDLVWMNPVEQISLANCGISQDDLVLLAKLLLGHPTLMFLDVRHNPKILSVAPLLQLFDATHNLLWIAAGVGTGLSDNELQQLHHASIERRRERAGLSASERALMVSHFEQLSEGGMSSATGGIIVRETAGLFNGMGGPLDAHCEPPQISISSVEQASKQAVGARKHARGVDTSISAAIQGFVAVFASQYLRRYEKWSLEGFVKHVFPDWDNGRIVASVMGTQR